MPERSLDAAERNQGSGSTEFPGYAPLHPGFRGSFQDLPRHPLQTVLLVWMLFVSWLRAWVVPQQRSLALVV